MKLERKIFVPMWYGPDGAHVADKDYFADEVKGRGPDREQKHLIVDTGKGLFRVRPNLRHTYAGRQGCLVSYTDLVTTKDKDGK